MSGAGTDADIFVVLFGEYGDSDEIHLKESETNRKPFKNGQTDVFTASNVLDLGRLIKLRVWHNNKGKLLLKQCHTAESEYFTVQYNTRKTLIYRHMNALVV